MLVMMGRNDVEYLQWPIKAYLDVSLILHYTNSIFLYTKMNYLIAKSRSEIRRVNIKEFLGDVSFSSWGSEVETD